MRTSGSFRLWICFALGIGVGAATLPVAHPAAAAAADNERATRQLFQAVQSADLPAVQASLAAGADVDARDRWGMTPTDIAIDRGHYRIAHFLVSVRNQRREQEAHVQGQTTPAAAVAASSPAASAPAARSAAATAAPVDGARLDAVPLAGGQATAAGWPAGKPNPFDPTAPAPGSQLNPPPRALSR